MLFLLLLLTASACLAAAPKLPGGEAQKIPPAALLAIEQVTKVRWAVQNDAAINDNRLRLVLDVSGPVEVDKEITAMPAPHLAVTIKGAVPRDIDSNLNLDGKFASSVSITTDGKNSTFLITLSVMAEDSDCRIFTLPADASTNKPFRVVIDICEPAPQPGFSYTPGLKDKVIVIDPGHGGSDHGAIGPGKTSEKMVTLSVAGRTKALLEAAGAKVIMTRQEDCDVSPAGSPAVDELKCRVAIANDSKADVFLSIHTNAAPNPLSNGTAAYYYKKTSYDALLAQNIQRSIVQAGGLRDRGFFPANFYVVKWTGMPAVLAELAFISNTNEEASLNDPQFQQKMAQGLVEGLDRFFVEAAKRKVS
jgi:N-acetylmuramoyl-L-alanine amidase